MQIRCPFGYIFSIPKNFLQSFRGMYIIVLNLPCTCSRDSFLSYAHKLYQRTKYTTTQENSIHEHSTFNYYLYHFYWSGNTRLPIWNCVARNLSSIWRRYLPRKLCDKYYFWRNYSLQPTIHKAYKALRNRQNHCREHRYNCRRTAWLLRCS